jgi:hypothetical protein
LQNIIASIPRRIIQYTEQYQEKKHLSKIAAAAAATDVVAEYSSRQMKGQHRKSSAPSLTTGE